MLIVRANDIFIALNQTKGIKNTKSSGTDIDIAKMIFIRRYNS